MLVEVTTVDQLVERLRNGKYKQREEILADSQFLHLGSHARSS